MPRTKAKAQKAKRHREKPDALALAIGQRVQKLRKARDEKGSFDAVVEETGLGRGYVSELERGLVVPTVTALAKLATALEVNVADLLMSDDSPRDLLYVVTRELPRQKVEELLTAARSMSAAVTKGSK